MIKFCEGVWLIEKFFEKCYWTLSYHEHLLMVDLLDKTFPGIDLHWRKLFKVGLIWLIWSCHDAIQISWDSWSSGKLKKLGIVIDPVVIKMKVMRHNIKSFYWWVLGCVCMVYHLFIRNDFPVAWYNSSEAPRSLKVWLIKTWEHLVAMSSLKLRKYVHAPISFVCEHVQALTISSELVGEVNCNSVCVVSVWTIPRGKVTIVSNPKSRAWNP